VSDHHVHGRADNASQDDDGFDLPHKDDPRVGASPAEIAYINELESKHPDRPLDTLVAESPWLDTNVTLA
jgi:hypothetical protein